MNAPAPRAVDSEESRFARFDAVTAFLADVSRERPLAIVLDDVHWGGDVTERMRKAVTNRIRDVIEQIERYDSDLAKYLTKTIRMGKFCAYEPL